MIYAACGPAETSEISLRVENQACAQIFAGLQPKRLFYWETIKGCRLVVTL